MLEIDYLKIEIENNTDSYPITDSFSWSLSVDLEKLVPESLFLPRKKGHIKRAARLLFVRYVTGRNVTSFKMVKDGELLRIRRWIEGNGPSPSDEKPADEQRKKKEVRKTELVYWWTNHKKEIHNFAEWLKHARQART